MDVADNKEVTAMALSWADVELDADALVDAICDHICSCCDRGVCVKSASDLVLEYVAAIRGDERERCAKIAESIAVNCDWYGGSVREEGRDPLIPINHSDAHDACHAALEIAERIRRS